jgi:hypothetical protein
VYYTGDLDSIAGHVFNVLARYKPREDWEPIDSIWICGRRTYKPETSTNARMKVYPNPVTSTVNIYHESLALLKEGLIEVFSASTGMLEAAYPISSTDVINNKITLDMSKLMEGAYVIRYNGQSQVFVKKK